LNEAGHVHNVEEIRCGEEVQITANCVPERSIRKTPYTICLELDSLASRKVVNSAKTRCSCPSGISAKCKHSAAVLLYINEERSEGPTDEEKKWKRPSKKAQSLYPKGEAIETLYKLPSTTRPTFKMEGDNAKKLADELAMFGLHHSALHKTLTTETDEDNMDIDTVDEAVPLPLQELLQLKEKFETYGSLLSPKNDPGNVYKSLLCSSEKAQGTFIF